jgi:hypothetical protein
MAKIWGVNSNTIYMRKIYAPFILIFFASCFTQVNYLGTSFPQTKKVDVFVSQSAVKKPFEIIGKGYVNSHGIPEPSVEVIQQKAVEKAKLKGANAVVIEDYYLVDKTSTIITKTDSLKRTQTNADTNPAVSTGFTILFLRYTD